MRAQTKIIIVSATAGALILAGCGKQSSDSAASSPTAATAATASTSTTAASTATTATTAVAGAYYLYATSAKLQGASVTINGTTATFSSGGADDGHWVDSGKQVATVLALTQPVKVLTSATTSKVVQASDFPAYLPTDQWGKLFRIDGDVSTPEGLTEIYHP